jgi:hypothetical protein
MTGLIAKGPTNRHFNQENGKHRLENDLSSAHKSKIERLRWKMRASRRFFMGLICLIGFILPASASTANSSSSAGSSGFQLVILKQDWHDLKLGCTYAQTFPLLKSINPSERLFSVGISDVESYNWTRQIITLTAESTENLIKALPQEKDLKNYIQYMARAKRERGWGNPIEPALHLKGFLVTVDDELIYGGIFLEPMSELAAVYPVIRPGMKGNKAVLHLLPVQIPFVAYDPMSSESTAWNAAIAPEGAGIWTQFPPHMKSQIINIGESKDATEFRDLIKNTKVREIMEKTGKLKP